MEKMAKKMKDLGELSQEPRIFTRCVDETTEAQASSEALFLKADCLPSHFFGDDTPQPAAACEEASFITSHNSTIKKKTILCLNTLGNGGLILIRNFFVANVCVLIHNERSWRTGSTLSW